LRFIEAALLPSYVDLAVGGHAMPGPAFRSPQEPTEAAALLDIRQTVRDLELYTRVLYESKEIVMLKIQIQKEGKPLAKRRVSLVRHARTLYSRNTSAKGAVEFPRLAPGRYIISIVQESVETELVLRSSQREGQQE
jgi:hypothetical protein